MGQNYILADEVLHYQGRGSGRSTSMLTDPIQVLLYLCLKSPRSVRVGSILKILFHRTGQDSWKPTIIRKREKPHANSLCPWFLTLPYIYKHTHWRYISIYTTQIHKVYLCPYQYSLSCVYCISTNKHYNASNTSAAVHPILICNKQSL